MGTTLRRLERTNDLSPLTQDIPLLRSAFNYNPRSRRDTDAFSYPNLKQKFNAISKVIHPDKTTGLPRRFRFATTAIFVFLLYLLNKIGSDQDLPLTVPDPPRALDYPRTALTSTARVPTSQTKALSPHPRDTPTPPTITMPKTTAATNLTSQTPTAATYPWSHSTRYPPPAFPTAGAQPTSSTSMSPCTRLSLSSSMSPRVPTSSGLCATK